MRTSPFALACAALTSCLHAVDDERVDVDATDPADAALGYFHDRPPGRSIHVVDVDLCEPDVEIVTTGPGDGVRTVSSFAARTGATVAINGGHTWGGVPKVSAHDGAFFGDPDATDIGQAVFGDGLATFIHQRETYAAAPAHSEVLSGLLTLVHDGVAQHDVLPHGEYTCSVQHPRTLLGLTADRRRLLLVVVDGRSPSAGRLGMTCREAADYMVSLGAHWALNLDGGGSSAMFVDGAVVNRPSDGAQRPVGSHLAVVRRAGARGHCPDAPVAAPPPPAPTACGRLGVDEGLAPGATVTSCDGRVQLAHQGDGNVVLYGPGGALWSTGTNGSTTSSFVMQGDGNAVLYSGGGRALWSTATAGHPGATIGVQDDGNLVVYGFFGDVLWASGTAIAPPPPAATPTPTAAPTPAAPPSDAAPSSCGLLDVDEVLAPGAVLSSCDARFALVHKTDGEVILLGPAWSILWASGTRGASTSGLVMQGDGNLVLYAADGSALWHSGTQGNDGASLAVQDDGNVVVYGAGGALWATGTAVAP